MKRSRKQKKVMRTDAEEYATFDLALQLHMTVAELRQRMSGSEFVMWMAFRAEKARRETRAMKAAR